MFLASQYPGNRLQTLFRCWLRSKKQPDTFQGDGITISSVIPALLGTDDILSSTHYEQFETLASRLRQALRDRFQDIIAKDECMLATVLDSRYKLIPFVDTDTTGTGRNDLALKVCTKREASRRLSTAVDQAKRTTRSEIKLYKVLLQI